MNEPVLLESPMELMEAARKFSELSPDPYMKVGAAAAYVQEDGRFLMFAGGRNIPPTHAQENFFDDRVLRRPYMIHAEANLAYNLAMTTYRGSCVVAITLLPCVSCMNLLAALDVRKLYYAEAYDKDFDAFSVAEMHRIKVELLQ